MIRVVPRAKAVVLKTATYQIKNEKEETTAYTLDKVHSNTQKMCTSRPKNYNNLWKKVQKESKRKLLLGSGDNGVRHSQCT